VVEGRVAGRLGVKVEVGAGAGVAVALAAYRQRRSKRTFISCWTRKQKMWPPFLLTSTPIRTNRLRRPVDLLISAPLVVVELRRLVP
jgi:hypothetical protein